MNSWNGKPYHSLDFHLKEMFGRKVYKLALDGGMTCPKSVRFSIFPCGSQH